MFKNISFRNQLGIIFTIGMLLLALISSVVLSELTSQRVEDRLIDEGLKLTETFAEQSKIALLYQSDESATEAANVIMSFPDIQAAEVVDATHHSLYVHETLAGHEGAIRPWPESVSLYRDTADAWEFASPVYTGADIESTTPFDNVAAEAELIGHVRLIMSKATLHKMELDIFRYNLLVSLGLASILLLALLIITSRLTRPLQNLAGTMRKAQQGEKSIRAELRGTTDIRDMESAFNTMMNVLEGREEAIKQARDQALDSARAKGEFAANVSHELRTPMNGVMGMLDLLGDTRLEDKQQEFVGVARSSAESLLHLIDDLLDFSKAEAGKTTLSMGDFDLCETTEQIVALLAAQAEPRGIEFACVSAPDIPQQLVGDCDRIRQVLVNLAGNAIKFTERGSVGIEVSLLELTSDQVRLRFEVWDTGLGISPEQQKRIFQVFSQADESTTRKFGGTGLGLAISRQLVELMGGEMGVESVYGEGSRFWFTLPLARQCAEATASRQPRIKDTTRRILIVDNNALVQRSLGCVLDRQRLDWDAASSLAEAQEKIRAGLGEQPYQVVLLDEQLDGGRGVELLAYIRSLSDGPHIDVVPLRRQSPGVLTGEAFQAEPGLLKPVLQKHLINCLNGLNGSAANAANDEECKPGGPANIMFRGSRVLVVEDDRANQQVVLAMLELMACDADVVNNGKECLAQIARASYDLILMDCHMPELDGYKATTIIREYEAEDNHIPIIAMTANVTEGESDRCIAVGMDDYLAKPLSRDTLREKLLCWLDANEVIGESEQEVYAPAQLVVDGQDIECIDDVIDQQVLRNLEAQLGPAVEKIVQALVEDLPIYLEALETALRQAEARALADMAHTIKGSAGNIGATRLVALCRQLEAQARRGDTARAEQKVAEICEASHAVVAWLKNIDFSEGALVTPEHLPGLLAGPDQGAVYSGQPRVLIVDDDRGSRLAMAEVLRNEGYWVDEATDGEQALVRCEEQAPDLVLMDAVMPKMDGFTACSLLQKLSQTRNVPVLIITALNDEASINKAFAAGATDYIAKPVNFWVLSKRITHLVQAHHAERHVHQLAYKDTLTGLPNRVMFNEHMADKLARPNAKSSQLALLFLDLDRFKLVNDTLGHETGDLLLKYFAERVLGCLRKDDMVARFGGDEFTILLDRIKSRDAVCQVAEKIHEQLSRPFVFMGKEMYISTSIGIAMYPEHGEDIGTLLKGADMAMYRAKKLGDRYQFYESQMEADVSRRLALENDLRGALDRGEFVVFYQPQEDLKSGQVTAMEALLRWEHPERGLVGPDEFIYLAEETGQILQIGEWVLRKVCKQLQHWRQRGYKMICASVNMSGKQLTNPGIVDTVSSILKETGLPAQYLELEITESTIMEDPEQVVRTLAQLKAMGLSLAIDDFGTGYSSLNYLKRFPIDVIKIDRSFVCDIITNQVDADIVKTIIDLAHVLDVSVVAEGVETEMQRAFLKKQGCDIAQGYYLSRPIPVDKIEDHFLGTPSQIDKLSGS